MPLLSVFVVAFAGMFYVRRRKGEPRADCIHKGFIAGIVATLLAFAASVVVTNLS